jgi:hypothetical protein
VMSLLLTTRDARCGALTPCFTRSSGLRGSDNISASCSPASNYCPSFALLLPFFCPPLGLIPYGLLSVPSISFLSACSSPISFAWGLLAVHGGRQRCAQLLALAFVASKVVDSCLFSKPLGGCVVDLFGAGLDGSPVADGSACSQDFCWQRYLSCAWVGCCGSLVRRFTADLFGGGLGCQPVADGSACLRDLCWQRCLSCSWIGLLPLFVDLFGGGLGFGGCVTAAVLGLVAGLGRPVWKWSRQLACCVWKCLFGRCLVGTLAQ